MAKRGAAAFSGARIRSIKRNEIYHRLEWFFDKSHNPAGQHKIPPAVPIALLWRNLPLESLCVSMNQQTAIIPAWNSPLFHNVPIPWVSGPTPGAIGIRDVKNFGDLIDCVVSAYGVAGWNVT